MKSFDKPTLIEQREILRRKLLTQRILIARQIDPSPAESNVYPRSMTMRFLTQRPELALKLLAEFAAMMVGARFFRSMNTALAVARILKSASVTREQRLSAPTTVDN